MVRIKGANSDYVYTGDSTEPIKEDKNADPLYLKIFICPNDMPSRVEKPHQDQWCEGTDETCPSPEKKGHAMICLHQQDGISLVTPNTVKAKGAFAVESNSGKEVLRVSENHLSFRLKPNKNQEISLKISEEEVSMQLGGANISITQAGDIELSPQNQHQVTIKGNLTVEGKLEVKGDFDLPAATKRALTTEIIKAIEKT